MRPDSPDEVVFTVAGSTAAPARRISLEEAGLKEREHLQEWVIAHPEILGPEVLIVTFEFDRWSSAAGPQKDRLDVLGLGSDGRIVVAELKRGQAPDTVEMQALKYAAMASRFTPSLLAEYHAKFTRHAGQAGLQTQALTDSEAHDRLETHSDVGLLPDQLLNPRLVLLAESYPQIVTATAVWLNERGIDITLMRYQAYRTSGEQIVLTVSQLYPVREVAEFEVAPHTAKKAQQVASLPQVPWSEEDLAELASLDNATALAVVDLCALSPDTWISANEVYARAGVSMRTGSAQLGGFGITVKSKFKRSNPPYAREWSPDGSKQSAYRLDPDLAAMWRNIRGETIISDADGDAKVSPNARATGLGGSGDITPTS